MNNDKVQRTDCSVCRNQTICMFVKAHEGLGAMINELVENNQGCPWVGRVVIECQYAQAM